DSRDTVFVVSHPHESQLGMFKEEIECIVESSQSEIAIRLAAREVVLILTQKITEHVKRILHIGGAHFSTSNHAPNDATTEWYFCTWFFVLCEKAQGQSTKFKVQS